MLWCYIYISHIDIYMYIYHMHITSYNTTTRPSALALSLHVHSSSLALRQRPLEAGRATTMASLGSPGFSAAFKALEKLIDSRKSQYSLHIYEMFIFILIRRRLLRL